MRRRPCISKQCRPLLDLLTFTIYLMSTLDLHCLSNSFIWVLGFIGLTDCVQIISSALKVYASVNNLSVIHVSGRFMYFCMEPVLSRTYCLLKWHNTLAPVSLEQVAIQLLLLFISAIFRLNCSSYETSLGKYIPPPDSAKTQRVVYLSIKTRKRLRNNIFSQHPKSTVQISTRTAT